MENEDYQWFASMVNIISICMELRKSEDKAQEEKKFLADLFKHMPVGYVRMKLFYDEEGHVKDYYFMVRTRWLRFFTTREGIVGPGNMLVKLIRILWNGCLIWNG